MSALRDAWIVASFELVEALRSKRVLVLALLYVGGAVAGSVLFIDLLASIEATLASTLMVADPSKPGAMTRALIESEQFRAVVSGLIRDPKLTDRLITLPPLATFYGWLSLTFLPVLVMLTSVESITQELQSGSARFSLVRCDRLSWAVGKLLGQSALMLASLALGSLATLIVGLFRMQGVEVVPTLLWLLMLSARASIYGFAYVGLALGLSQLTRSVQVARALGLGVLALLGILRAVLDSDWTIERIPVLAASLRVVLPRSHQLDLWRPEVSERMPAMVMLVALGISYFAIGHLVRKRRDT